MPSTPTIQAAYLAGTTYCGSTLLAFMLDCHLKIASVGETSIYPRTHAAEFNCTCGKTLADCEFWTKVYANVKAQGLVFDARHWNNEYRYANPRLHRLLTEYSYQPWKRAVRRALGALCPPHLLRVRRIDDVNRAFMKAVLEVSGADVFFDTTKDLLRMRHLLRIPGVDTKIIRVVRDVRAFVNSCRRNRNAPLDAAAHEWYGYQSAVDEMVRGLSADHVIEVRYEDLCRDPQAHFDRMCRFLGLEPVKLPAEIQSSEHHIIGNRMRLKASFAIELDESWRQALTPDEIGRVMRIAGATNQRLGYAA